MKKIIIASIVICLISYLYNSFFTQSMVTGTYVNKNYKNEGQSEIPHEIDTLRLMDNNKFTSSFYGDGTYFLSYSLSGTEIELTYTYEFGLAGLTKQISRRFFGSPRILLNKDRNHYYEKTE